MSLADTYHDDLRESLDHLGRPRNHRRPFPLPQGPHPAASSIWLTRDGGASRTAQSIPPGAACNGDCTSALYGYPLEWVSCLSSGLCRAGGGNADGCGFCGSTYAPLAPQKTHKSGPRTRFPTGFPQTKRHSPAHGGTPAKVAL
jgi:hypothetical protein